MNDDLISRKALRLKLIDRQITTVFYDNAKRHEVGCIIEMLDNAPAVDAEKVCEQMGLVKEAMDMAKAYLRPVRHGRWVERPNTKGQVYCSECGTLEKTTDNNFKSMHCPHCGAKMDGDSHEG